MQTKRVFDCSTQTMIEVALTPEEIATMTPSLADAKKNRIQYLESENEKARSADVSYMGTVFQADAASRSAVAHAVASYTAQGTTPSGFWWKDKSNNKVSMALIDLQGLDSAISQQVWDAFQNLDAKKTNVNNATTNNEVNLVVW